MDKRIDDQCSNAASPPKGLDAFELKWTRALASICEPPSYWTINTSAADIVINNIVCSNVNLLWPYCSFIPKPKVEEAAKTDIATRCTAVYEQRCSACESFLLADFNKRRGVNGHAIVFVKRDGTVVAESEADCRIEFDYSFDFVMQGEVGLCFSPE